MRIPVSALSAHQEAQPETPSTKGSSFRRSTCSKPARRVFWRRFVLLSMCAALVLVCHTAIEPRSTLAGSLKEVSAVHPRPRKAATSSETDWSVWTAESDQIAAQFGISVSTAGDVNGDGFSDVIVGSYLYDNGQTDEGRAYVYLGSAQGLSGTPAWIAESDMPLQHFGRAVASAGDVNGDGFDDVIVGAPTYSDNPSDGTTAYAFVYLGSAQGLQQSPAWSAKTGQGGDRFGRAVASAGDVNGDGFDDVIVGAYFYDNGQINEGSAFVYLGSPSGLSSTPAWIAEGDQDGAGYGWAVAGHDLNGDGFSDVIVGAPHYDNGKGPAGAVFAYMGSSAGLSPSPSWIARSSDPGSDLGMSIGIAGDVNGDGFTDVILGARFFDSDERQQKEGAAFVYLGSPSGLSPSPAWVGRSDYSMSHFGYAVGSAGDVNGDGFDDVVVGAIGYRNCRAGEGRIYLYLGSPSGPSASPSWTAEGDQAYGDLGISVAGGDVDGDGLSDVIAGAYLYDAGQHDEGRAYVYRGSALFQPRSTPTAQACWSVARDYDDDGRADILWQNRSTGQEAIWLMNSLSLADGSLLPTVGDTNWEIVGSADHNGDGKADILWHNRRTRESVMWLMSNFDAAGFALPTVPEAGWEIVGPADYDGDGKADILWKNHDTSKLAIWLMDGPTVAAAALISDAPADSELAMSADYDGDGKADILWRDRGTGRYTLWRMDGFSRVSVGLIPPAPGPSWEIVRSADYNADGKADLLWRNQETGEGEIWFLDVVTWGWFSFIDTIGSGALPVVADPDWVVLDSADYNGDGKSDILWENRRTAEHAIWLMDGVTRLRAGLLPTVPDRNWQIVKP